MSAYCRIRSIFYCILSFETLNTRQTRSQPHKDSSYWKLSSSSSKGKTFDQRKEEGQRWVVTNPSHKSQSTSSQSRSAAIASPIDSSCCLIHFHHIVATLWRLMGFFYLAIGLAQDSRGADVDLSTFKGKVIIVVNVASKWSPIHLLYSLSGFWVWSFFIQ